MFTDIDECTEGQGCKMNAACENYDGGYNCTCDVGFKESSYGGPKDYDCEGK